MRHCFSVHQSSFPGTLDIALLEMQSTQGHGPHCSVLMQTAGSDSQMKRLSADAIVSRTPEVAIFTGSVVAAAAPFLDLGASDSATHPWISTLIV